MWSLAVICRPSPSGARSLECALAAIVKTDVVVAHPDESLRVIVYRMAETGLTRFPVMDREHRASFESSRSLTCSRRGR